jgi:lysyl-tRNA synthetase class 2
MLYFISKRGENMERKLSEQELVRREKMEALKEMGIDPFGSAFDASDNSKTLNVKYDQFSKEELTEKENEIISITGRIMTKRGKGKAGFAHIQDVHGQIQIYVRSDKVSEQEFLV